MLISTEITYTYTCDHCGKELIKKEISEKGMIREVKTESIISILNPFKRNESLGFCSNDCVINYIRSRLS
jgi:hypothetical protein